ncbi:50S ribosomal protein L16 [Candidatus Microgenomates bacterium]|nr:50S ribosomal protein L16 [Candidatus Microgenomates bacterium]
MPLLGPRREKHRTSFRGQMAGIALRGNTIAFGEYGIMAMSRGWVSAAQLESARKAMTHFTAKGGRVWLRVFPSKAISKQPLDHRQGGGKGEVAEHVVTVRPGLILFEIGGIPKESAVEAIRRAGHKLSVQTKLISKI